MLRFAIRILGILTGRKDQEVLSLRQHPRYAIFFFCMVLAFLVALLFFIDPLALPWKLLAIVIALEIMEFGEAWGRANLRSR